MRTEEHSVRKTEPHAWTHTPPTQTNTHTQCCTVVFLVCEMFVYNSLLFVQCLCVYVLCFVCVVLYVCNTHLSVSCAALSSAHVLIGQWVRLICSCAQVERWFAGCVEGVSEGERAVWLVEEAVRQHLMKHLMKYQKHEEPAVMSVWLHIIRDTVHLPQILQMILHNLTHTHTNRE